MGEWRGGNGREERVPPRIQLPSWASQNLVFHKLTRFASSTLNMHIFLNSALSTRASSVHEECRLIDTGVDGQRFQGAGPHSHDQSDQ